MASDAEIRNAELEAIAIRRLRNAERRDPVNSELTGVAFSGGGIRSASVCLEALQGLEVALGAGGAGGIDAVDYMSTAGRWLSGLRADQRDTAE